jgi:hypothetical protein
MGYESVPISTALVSSSVSTAIATAVTTRFQRKPVVDANYQGARRRPVHAEPVCARGTHMNGVVGAYRERLTLVRTPVRTKDANQKGGSPERFARVVRTLVRTVWPPVRATSRIREHVEVASVSIESLLRDSGRPESGDH